MHPHRPICLGLLLLLLAWCRPLLAMPALAEYGKLPAVELMRLSPSGERFAFIAVIGEQRRLGVVTTEGKLLHSEMAGTTKVREIAWAGDDHVLVTVSATINVSNIGRVRQELANVLHIDLRDGKSAPVFGDRRGVANLVLGSFGSVSDEGQRAAYFGGITYGRTIDGGYVLQNRYRDLYKVNLETGKFIRAAKGSEREHHWVLDSDGKVLAHSEYVAKDGLWQLYAGSDRETLVLQRKSPLGDIELIGQGRKPGTVLVVDGSGATDAVNEIAIKDGTAIPLFDAAGQDLTLTGYLFDPLSNRLLGATTREEPGAYFFDDLLQARYQGARKAFPGLRSQLESFSHDLNRLIVKTDGNGDAGSYWLVDIASGKAKLLGDAYPAIKPADVANTQWFKYKAADGLEMEGVLTLPPQRKVTQLPLILMPHGGPIGIDDRPGFDWWAQAYAAAGYAVFQPNYRGSSGYGKAFRLAGLGEWGGKMQTDLSDGIAALASQGIVDRQRVCIVGGSYGGYAALAGVTLQQGLYRCAVSVAGPSDMPKFYRWQIGRSGYHSEQRRYWQAVTGADNKGLDHMAAMSPARLAARADAPILLIHGKDDTRVPIEQSQTMAAALKEADKPHELLVLPGEDHFLSREASRIALLNASLAFLKRHNPPD